GLLIDGPGATERHSRWRDHLAVDEVVDRFADEQAAREARAEELVAVDDRAARRREPPRGTGIVEARQHAAEREHWSRPRHRRHLWAHLRRREVRVAAEVVVGQDVVPHWHAVVAAEPVVEIIAAAAVLRLTSGSVDVAGVRADAEVAAGDVDDLAGLERSDSS